MTIVLSCPGCGKKYELDGSLAGKKARCRKCTQEFRIPESSAVVGSPERPPEPGDTLPATNTPPPPAAPPSADEETIVDPDLGYILNQPAAEPAESQAAGPEPAAQSGANPPGRRKARRRKKGAGSSPGSSSCSPPRPARSRAPSAPVDLLGRRCLVRRRGTDALIDRPAGLRAEGPPFILNKSTRISGRSRFMVGPRTDDRRPREPAAILPVAALVVALGLLGAILREGEPRPPAPRLKVDPTSAPAAVLASLPTIGPSRAEAIVEEPPEGALRVARRPRTAGPRDRPGDRRPAPAPPRLRPADEAPPARRLTEARDHARLPARQPLPAGRRPAGGDRGPSWPACATGKGTRPCSA